MPILTVEDARNEHFLHKPCKKVKDFGSTEILVMIQQMRKIALEPNAAGVAAPQIGKNYRAFVLCTKNIPVPMFFFNPVLKGVSEEMHEVVEGCLSVPGKAMRLQRHLKVKLAWQDELGKRFSMDGKKFEYTFEGFEGQAIQHELDHLDGVLCSDRADEIYEANQFEAAFNAAKDATIDKVEELISLDE